MTSKMDQYQYFFLTNNQKENKYKKKHKIIPKWLFHFDSQKELLFVTPAEPNSAHNAKTTTTRKTQKTQKQKRKNLKLNNKSSCSAPIRAATPGPTIRVSELCVGSTRCCWKMTGGLLRWVVYFCMCVCMCMCVCVVRHT